MVTKASIKVLLETNDKADERAIIVLFERQTYDEQATSSTCHDNQRGFSAAHASKGSYYARWIKSGRHLTGWHLQNARRMTQHYTHQLLLAAQAKCSQGGLKAPATDQKPDGMTQEEYDQAKANVAAGKCPDGCCGGEEEVPVDQPGRNPYRMSLAEARHEVERLSYDRRHASEGGYKRVQTGGK